jgi:hypothetical protein
MSTPAYLFGAKLANQTQFYERMPQDKKKKNPLMRAEAAGESDDTPEFKFDDMDKESAAYKFGKSMCQPCDMSKHDRSKYQTGPMRALSAEEAVKPTDGGVTEVQETEHAEKDIANSGQKTGGYKFAGKGGLGGALGQLMAPAARQFAKAPVTGPAPMAMPRVPARTPAAPQMGRTVLPSTAKPGSSLTHKQYGQGTVKSVTDGVATAQFPNNVTRQYRVGPASPATPAAPAGGPAVPKTPAAQTPPPARPPVKKPTPAARPAQAAAAPAAAARAPSMADRAFSAARTYGNLTGVVPTSRTGLAMAGLNPMLQSGAGMLDEQMGTNFAGQKSGPADWTSRVGQVAFPTRKAQTYIGQQLPGWLSQASQAAEQFIPKQ